MRHFHPEYSLPKTVQKGRTSDAEPPEEIPSGVSDLHCIVKYYTLILSA